MQLQVDSSRRFLQTADGQPFFWLGDTAWQLFHYLNRAEADRYLRNRAELGFNVIQAVALAELDGINTPNAYGHRPFRDLETLTPDEAYWGHVDAIVARAAELGMFTAMLPMWGDKWHGDGTWGKGPLLFDASNIGRFGEWIARRYADQPIIWVLGGDRPCLSESDFALMATLADGLRQGDGGRGLITYHPGGPQERYVPRLHTASWMDLTMIQSSHCHEGTPNYPRIQELYALAPTKPVLDAEPCYEDFPVMTADAEKGWRPFGGYRYEAYHMRRAAWWSVLAGACGHTYGAQPLWMMWEPGRPAFHLVRHSWQEALAFPGAAQMRHLKNLLTSLPCFTRRPAPEMVVNQADDPFMHVAAARDHDTTFACLYVPLPQTVEIDLSAFAGKKLRAWWFDPRTGERQRSGTWDGGGTATVSTPHEGYGREEMDWVLLLEAC